jgi:pimeloyl-ACP methyl ester carboxylesterase
MLGPLAFLRLQERLIQNHQVLPDTSINLAEEKFLIYVPERMPSSGYALLVFIPPWNDAKLPKGWQSVLDRFGIIFVTAGRSGNDQGILNRRIPLALAAAENILAQYRIDSNRVFVGGFSGGSRVALRLAVSYPDLFHGVLLNAGSDPIGTSEIPLPEPELLSRLQESTRLAYATGSDDEANLILDSKSMHAMKQWCVFNIAEWTVPWSGHVILGPSPLSSAFSYLLEPSLNDPDPVRKCRAGLESDLAQRRKPIDDLVATGDWNSALPLIEQLDQDYSGLATADIRDLWNRRPK